jgi:hypothetical protein
MPRLRALIGLAALVLLAGLLPVATVNADPLTPSNVTLAGVGDVEVGQEVVLTATVTEPTTGYDGDGATITFTSISGGGDPCTDVAVSTAATECHLTLPTGSYTYEATYSGNTTVAPSTSNQVSFDVTPAPPTPGLSSVTLAGPGSVVVGNDVTLTAMVAAPAGYDAGATIDFDAVAGGGPECDDIPVSTSGTTCDLGTNLAIGFYTYEAVYSGSATTLGSTSIQFTFEVTAVPDTTLEASGVTINYTTFYPAKDSYRDRLTIHGNRNEPIRVTIRIYSPTGKRIKTVTSGLAAGAYSYQWSGRNSAGTILASGKYKIVQSLKDVAGNKLVVTKYATLSHKKLVTKTKYVTKLGRTISVSNVPIIVSSSGYAKLDARRDPVVVGYQFTIPSATRYKSISFQAYAKGPKTSPSSVIGVQNFSWCPYVSGPWVATCFDRLKPIGGSGTNWYKTSANVSANRSGHRVRGLLGAADGIYYIYKVRVKVVYQVLR